MKTSQYVKYVTEKLVTHLDGNQKGVSSTRMEERHRKKSKKSPYSWFGVLSYTLFNLSKRKRQK